jgi:quinol monooxygenase YgiN
MDEIGIVASYKVAPRDDGAFEAAVREMIEAMRAEEFPHGGVKSYAYYRVPHIFGSWYAFAQFTKQGFAVHAKGPKVQAAVARMMSLLAVPLAYEELEPVIIHGSGERIPGAPPRPSDADPAKDVGVLFSFRVNPEDNEKLEAVMQKIFKIVERVEISTGNVLTYNLYRDPKSPGRWVMFEHFTAKGSADHATHPDIFPPGLEQINLLPEPFSRILLNPCIVLGCGEPLPRS